MARLLYLIVCLSISLWFEACVSGSNAGPTITFQRANMIGSEGDIISFHLIAIGTFDDEFSVEVMVESLTATHLWDYALVANPFGNTTLANFTVGQTNSSIVLIFLSDNNAWESLECFTVRIMIPPGVEAMLGSPDSMTVCINDDDEVKISFMEDSLMVNEGMGTISLQLNAEGVYTTCFNVSVICFDIFPVQAKVSGRRTNETDAYPNSFTFQFCDLGSSTSQSTKSVSTEMTINITNDLLSEPTECFICLILRPSATRGINVQDPDTLTVCIKDNDVLEVCFAKNEYKGIEGNNVTVQLKATGEFVEPFKARILLSALPPQHPFKTVEAEEGEDYMIPSDASVNGGIVEFNPGLGSESTALSLVLVDDDIVEKMEYFRLNFTFEEDPNNPSPIVLSKCSPDEVLVAIQDKDVPCVSFEESNVTGGEGDVVKLWVNRTGCIARKLKCKVRIESTTAEKGVDFRVKTKSVVFKKLNAESEVRTVRVKLLSGNPNCFRVVLKCKPKDLIGCTEPSATVCIQGN